MSRLPAVDLPRALLVGLGVAVALALIVATSTSTAAFDPFNPSWDGTSDLRGEVEDDPDVDGEFVRDSSRYDAVEPAGSVIVVVSDEHDGADAERLGGFVRAGGTLVVLDDFGGEGNDLLADVGAEARFDGRLLRDERHYQRGPAMPVATAVADDPLTADVDRLTLNHATALEPGDATVLVSTSELAYLVEEPEDDLEDAEAGFGPYPVATVEDVGEGEVVAVGDPSIVINAMREEPDNAVFLANLYADAERVLFDFPGADELPPLAAAVLTVRNQPLLGTLVGGLAVAGVAALSARRVRPALERLRRRLVGRSVDERVAGTPDPGLSDAERAAVLRRRHPDWEEERIQRVLTAITRAEGGAHSHER